MSQAMQGGDLGSATATMERSAYYSTTSTILSFSYNVVCQLLGPIYMNRPVAYLETIYWTPCHVCLLPVQWTHGEFDLSSNDGIH